ncbi:hypothetical protein [Cryobacterium sp. Hb1]|uniref:hypothetical protein n=1 Tax=Cryobacterium sp. Hb1 TaxID=1259147 RepID=UPI00106A4660|nr:hypothetical protein [Cryobacterium sp. Hb1]TFD72135.1 hypothetical protein E3T38_01170 [Cryobacterium sp. Hb1]
MHTDTSDEIPDQTQPKRSRLVARLRTISKPRKIFLASALAVVLATGGTFGTFAAVAAVQEAAHTSALADHKEATVTLQAAWELDAQADTDLTSDLAEASLLDAQVVALVAGTDGLVDGDARADLEAARAELLVAATSIATTQGLDLATGAVIETVTVPKSPAVKKSASTASIVESTVAVETLTSASGTELKSVTALSGDLEAAVADVTDTFPALTESVAVAGQARLDGTPSAGAPERDALAAAIAAVTSAGTENSDADALAVLSTYATAAAATSASHVAVEAERAAEAAAAAQAAADAAARAAAPRSSGGGGGSSGKGAGGGSSSGGGSTAPDVQTSTGNGGGSSLTGDQPWRPLQVKPGGSVCKGIGGGQEVTYGSTLMPPVDNYSYETYEVPGYGWGIHWTCDTGW